MTRRFSSDPVTVAAAVQGAFAIMAARIEARQDSRLLVDNELVTAEVYELVSLTLQKLDEGFDTSAPASGSEHDATAPPGGP